MCGFLLAIGKNAIAKHKFEQAVAVGSWRGEDQTQILEYGEAHLGFNLLAFMGNEKNKKYGFNDVKNISVNEGIAQ